MAEEKSFASDPQEPPQSPGPDPPQSPGGADIQMDEPATPAPATPQGDGAATPYTPLSATPSSNQGSLSQRWVTIHEVGADARGGGGAGWGGDGSKWKSP
jgi:hypothetical protein